MSVFNLRNSISTSRAITQADLDFLDQQSSPFRTALNIVGTPINTILNILDTPGSVVRNLLSGENAFKGFFSPENRSTGRDVLTNFFGYTPPNERITDPILGMDLGDLGVSIATDPLNLVGSLGGTTQAGRKALRLSELIQDNKLLTRMSRELGEGNIKNVNEIFDVATGKLFGNKKNIIPEESFVAKRKVDELLESNRTSILKLKESGVKELEGRFDASGIFQHNARKQLASGQRGLSFNIPLTEIGYTPTKVNELLAPLHEFGANKLNFLQKSRVGKGLSNLFIASPKTNTVRLMKELESTIARTAELPDAVFTGIGKTREEVEQLLEQSALDRMEDSVKLADKDRHLSTLTIDEIKDFRSDPKRLEQMRARSDFQAALTGLKKDVMLKAERKNTLEQLDESMESMRLKINEEYNSNLAKMETRYNYKRQQLIDKGMDTDTFDLEFIKDKEKLAKGRLDTINNEINIYNDRWNKINNDIQMVDGRGKLPEQLVDSIIQSGQDVLELQKNVGVAIDGLTVPWINYIKHTLTPEGKKFVYQLNKIGSDLKYTEAQRLLKQDFLSTTDNVLKRTLPELTATEKNQLFRKTFDIKYDVFSEDPIQSLIAMNREVNKATSRAASVAAAIDLSSVNSRKFLNENFGSLEADILTKKGEKAIAKRMDEMGYVGISTLLSKSPLRRVRVNGKTAEFGYNAGAKSISKTLENLGISQYIPKELEEDLVRIINFDDGAAKEIWPIIDPINSIYRAMITLAPAHLGTNFLGSSYMNAISGTANPKTYGDAANYLAKFFRESAPDNAFSKMLKPTDKLAQSTDPVFLKHAREFMESGAADKGFISDALAVINKTKSKPNNKYPWLSLDFALKDNPISQTSVGANRLADETARMVHFIEKRKQGLSILEAERSVKKYHFDYSELTSFEKKIMNRFVLFYTFGRKNLPFAIKEIFANRGARGFALASTRSLANYDNTPEFISEAGNIGLTDGSFIDIKNPLFEANKFSPQGGGLTRLVDKVGQQLSPWAKVPLELFADREFFRGRQLSELTRSEYPVPGFTTEVQTDRGVEHHLPKELALLFRENPTTRFQQVYRDFFDERVSTIPAQFGIRIRKFDEKQLLGRRVRDEVERLLQESPEVRYFKRPFSIEEKPSSRIENLLELLDASKELL